jgi:hypothetical protein
MHWSQLKKRVEERFAPSLRGRLEIWATSYRQHGGEYGEIWMTLDGERVVSAGELGFIVSYDKLAHRLRSERACANWQDATVIEAWRQAGVEAEHTLNAQGVFGPTQVSKALFQLFHLSIEAAVASNNPIIRAFALLDGRFGKRRLLGFDVEVENALVVQFFRIRCDAEGMTSTVAGNSVVQSTDN